jgi:hypothetical protein
MASKKIIDTSEFSPHNLLMPKISSMDHILTAAHDMTNALKHPHTDVQFVTIGYDTITALDQLAIFLKTSSKSL